jgi:cystathionine beta-lyase/cystathionine gamma-synthase
MPRRVRAVPFNTFASPYLQRSLELGAALLLQSGTKYLAGHSDVMCGVAAGSLELMARNRDMQILIGTVLDPQGRSSTSPSRPAWAASRP